MSSLAKTPKVLFLILALLFCGSSNSSTDAIWLSKIVSQNVMQLNRLANIFEISKSTLEELNSLNRKITDKRYQLLRIRSIVATTKELQNANPRGVDRLITHLEKGKRLGREYNDLANELTPKEKERLLETIDEADKRAKNVSEEIMELKLSRTYARLDVEQTVTNNQIVQEEEISPLVEMNDDVASSSLDQSEAAVVTARNTSLANKQNMENNKILAKQLTVSQEISDSLKKKELQELEKLKAEERFWGKGVKK